jgi:chemotaxis protein CheX
VNATLVTSLLDEATIIEITEQAWSALVGEEEFLVALPAPLPAETTSSWVAIAGPWNGVVVVTCGRGTAAELTRALLREHAPAELEDEDVDDALGEIANVVGGNVKAVLPGPSALGLPETGTTPPVAGPPEDTCRVEFIWRGQPLTITAQGSAGAPLPI